MVTTAKTSELKAMSNEELAAYMASWKESTGNYILCEMEFKRRQNSGNAVRGWLSLVISVIALGVSIAAFLSKPGP
jgi:hypothetical protein